MPGRTRDPRLLHGGVVIALGHLLLTLPAAPASYAGIAAVALGMTLASRTTAHSPRPGSTVDVDDARRRGRRAAHRREGTPMTTSDEMLAAARTYASTYPGGLPAAPARHVAVVACMDARIDVYALLGLELGQAHVLRNAGGVITPDMVRSLAISQRKLGTREIVLVHHTGCGMQTFTDDDFKAELEAETGVRPYWSPETFADPEADVRRSMNRIAADPFIPHKDAVRGFVLDIDTGVLTEVR